MSHVIGYTVLAVALTVFAIWLLVQFRRIRGS
jgi:hypothetical protein